MPGSPAAAPVSAAVADRPTGIALTPRTQRLLEGPIAPTLLRLAAPNVVVMLAQAAVTTLDGVFVGRLGPDALAGVSLVFPLFMLMQTMSAGGMGGGVASAIARALGAGRREDADSLVLHALVVAAGMAVLFAAGALWVGPALYRAMGASGGALAAAATYSQVLFGGALAYWGFNTLGSVVRGSGNMLLPATSTLGGAAVYVLLAPALIFGVGSLPGLGVAGAGLASVTSFTLFGALLLVYVCSRRSVARLRLRGARLEWRLFRQILGVGSLGSLNTVLTNLTVVLLTGLVAPFGTFALAGYGMGARLEYLQIPLVFGFGSALVTMVGTSIGAGDRARARRVAWIGAAMAAVVTGSIGLAAAVVPEVWMRLFSAEPAVVAAGSQYLMIVGPAYGFFGAGLALYFASQGAGRLLWPMLAGFARLVIAGGGGWVVVHVLGGGLAALFAVLALALVVYGIIVAAAIKAGAWERKAD
jgi:putative MATE family efflux protein